MSKKNRYTEAKNHPNQSQIDFFALKMLTIDFSYNYPPKTWYEMTKAHESVDMGAFIL